MKKLLLLSFALLFVSTTVFAANFAPAQLKLSGPSPQQYNFDGTNLTLPVTVTGTDAQVMFVVFTKGKAAGVSRVHNGFLGWHYVNKIDTCIYFSTQYKMPKGSTNVIWNGKDKNGVQVPKGDYTYYLWGYDYVTPRILAAQADVGVMWATQSWANMIEYGPDGKALANPVILQRPYKWTFGNDPTDRTLLQTCNLAPPTGYEYGAGVCYQPDDYNYVFEQIGKKDTKEMGIAKFKWVPNGVGELQTDWGDNGSVLTTALWNYCCFSAGVKTDGTYLVTGTGNGFESEAEADLRIWDIDDGSLLKKIDMSEFWCSVQSRDNGGQINGGPNFIAQRAT